jgi:hypothetical protein
MWTHHEMAADVVDEYAEVACLCRLRERASERDAVHNAIFSTAPTDDHTSTSLTSESAAVGGAADDREVTAPADGRGSGSAVVQRRRSVGHYLTLLRKQPAVVSSEAAYREALWASPEPYSEDHAVVAGQWAALVAKDVWQEALCSVWSHFCRAGLARTRERGGGLPWEEVRRVASTLTAGPPLIAAETPTRELMDALRTGTITLTDSSGEDIHIAEAPLEALRSLTAELDTATSGLVVVLELARRMRHRTGSGWAQASHIASGWQPSVAEVMSGLRDHLEEQPAVADTLWWLVSRFVIRVHESIAYSKLPEFTFRFRWEDGLLRFYPQVRDRFPLAAIRREPLASLTEDLGLWYSGAGDVPALTERGERFVAEVLT